MDKVKKEFMSPASLQVCFYLFVLLLLATPAAYIYDYNGFDFAELRTFLLALAAFYTFALSTHIEMRHIKSSSSTSFLHFLIPISQCFSLILLSLFALATIEYINGDLRLDRVYDPFITLFFVYLLRKNIESIKQDIGT